ncbi:hypothetical protein [Helicobacter trogontum]
MTSLQQIFDNLSAGDSNIFALDNASMKELYEIISIKTPIYILP